MHKAKNLFSLSVKISLINVPKAISLKSTIEDFESCGLLSQSGSAVFLEDNVLSTNSSTRAIL